MEIQFKTQTMWDRETDPGTVNDEESLTVQHFANDVNINQIVAKARKGQVYTLENRSPLFGDFTGLGSFHDVQNRLIEAKDEFMRLPVATRRYFDNDPGKLMDFLSDEKNRQKAIELGLVKKPEKAPVEPGPQKVVIVKDETKAAQ